uniref:Uncharacterized protein n=1 Tax=Meloidogyne javanica TaxID=6303 RepID=A0A915MTY4_MELJA
MTEKIDGSGNVKRVAWHNNKELVLSCILDPRFKLSFLDADFHELYKNWLISEAENQQQTDDLIENEIENEQDQSTTQKTNEFFSLFERCEKTISKQNDIEPLALELPSKKSLNARQKAE